MALSIAVTGVRYLLEGNRARVCKYASRVQEKKPQTPKKKTTAFDYSKWDHLDSDSDAEREEDPALQLEALTGGAGFEVWMLKKALA